MKKLFIIITLFVFNLSALAFAEEKVCSKFNIGCKISKFLSDTKEYQKDGVVKAREQTIDKVLPKK